jgi:hypothetical protein
LLRALRTASAGIIILREDAMSFQRDIARDLRRRQANLVSVTATNRLHGELPKQDLQAMLAEAWRNTAALPVDPEIRKTAKLLAPLLKGKRN